MNQYKRESKMITVTKKFNFCYGHYLPGYPGDCANMHGHNAEVEVEFENYFARQYISPLPNDMIIDFKDIKKYIQPIIDSLDHKVLNHLTNKNESDPFVDILLLFPCPTAENIVYYIAKRIAETKIGAGLVRVRVSETPDSWAEWRRDK